MGVPVMMQVELSVRPAGSVGVAVHPVMMPVVTVGTTEARAVPLTSDSALFGTV